MKKQKRYRLLNDKNIVNPLENIFLILTYVLSSICLLIIPYSTKYMIDKISVGDEIYIREILIFCVLIAFSALISFYFASYKVKELNLNFYQRLVEMLFKKSLKMYPSDYEQYDSGLLHNLYYGESQTIASALTNYLIIMPGSLIQSVIFLVIIFLIDIRLSIITVFAIPIYLLIVRYNAKKRTVLNQETIKTYDKFVKTTNNFKDHISQIQMSHKDIFFEEKYDEISSNNTKSHEKFYFHFFFGEKLTQFITNIIPVITLGIASARVINNSLSLGSLLMFIQISAFLFEPLTNVFHIKTEINSMKPYFDRLEDFLYKVSDENDKYDEFFDDVDKIRLENVDILNKNKEFLYNINLDINDIGLYIIKGKNGSGKSTLLRILGGLNSPSDLKGVRITIPKKFKNKISFLFYPLFNFEGNVKENILVGNSEVIYLKEMLDEDIYKREIKINPLNLSSGEAQKISLLRVINVDSKVIFLDEPITNLEPGSIEILKNHLKNIKDKKLIIAIMHSSHFDDIADEILTIEDTRVKLTKE